MHLFLQFLCIFKCSIKWNLRYSVKCNIEYPLKFTFILNPFVHSCALTVPPPCASSSGTQLLPQVHGKFQPQMHLIAHLYIDFKYTIRWAFRSTLSGVLNYTKKYTFKCNIKWNVKCVLFVNFLWFFNGSFTWNLRCTFKCNINSTIKCTL